MIRHVYQPEVPTMDLFVPAAGALAHVTEGSAIVGVARIDDSIRCYYEGGVYNPSMPFEEKMAHAAGRLSERYPTTAMGYFRADTLKKVGTVEWDPVLQGWIISELTDEAALRHWAGDGIPPVGGSEELRRRAAGLIIDNGRDMQAMITFQTAAQTGQDAVEAVIDYARKKQAPALEDLGAAPKE